jgi:hypothetical protein
VKRKSSNNTSFFLSSKRVALFSLHIIQFLKPQPPPTTVFSGETSISGTVAGGGTTMPEFQNSTKLRKNYMFQILSSSSIHFSNW